MAEKEFKTTVKYGESSSTYCVYKVINVPEAFEKAMKGTNPEEIRVVRIVPVGEKK